MTVLQVAGARGLSRSDDNVDKGCCEYGGGVDALAGIESSCCCVGCFDGVNGRVELFARFVGV